MKTRLGILLLTVVSSFGFAQDAPPPPPGGGGVTAGVAGPGGPGPQKHVMMFKRELGAWWKNAKVASQLQLTDNQIKQLEDVFYQHRLKLVDYGADMEKADMQLQKMLDADYVDEAQVNTQVDQVLAARGKMEREFTMLTLNFRKILTPDQWKQLRSIRGEQQDRMFFQTAPAPGVRVGPPGPQGELSMPEYVPQGADCTASEKNGMKVVQCTKNIEITTDTEHEL